MSKIENCEICGTPFSAFAITCNCHERKDSAFYTDEAGTQVVWEKEGMPFYVVRAGEMRIHAVSESGDEGVIRYTDQLRDFGIDTDKELAEWSAKPEEIFSWVNNSWFEIYTEKDSWFFSEPLHDIDEAIAEAKRLSAKFPNGITE
jgi:hypothetical protein